MDDSDQNLIEYLTEHEAVCPECEYALAGLQTDRCPECGLSLTIDHLKWFKNKVDVEQQDWQRRVQDFRKEIIWLAIILLANTGIVFYFFQAMKLSLFLILSAGVTSLIVLPCTSKRQIDSRFTTLMVLLVDKWLGGIILLCSLPVITAVMYILLSMLGMI